MTLNPRALDSAEKDYHTRMEASGTEKGENIQADIIAYVYISSVCSAHDNYCSEELADGLNELEEHLQTPRAKPTTPQIKPPSTAFMRSSFVPLSRSLYFPLAAIDSGVLITKEDRSPGRD